jgi:hypothetical protein
MPWIASGVNYLQYLLNMESIKTMKTADKFRACSIQHSIRREENRQNKRELLSIKLFSVQYFL